MKGTETFNLCFVQSTILPQSVNFLFRFLSEIVGNSLFQVRNTLWGVKDRHHLQQFQLCIIQYCCCHNKYVFLINFVADSTTYRLQK